MILEKLKAVRISDERSELVQIMFEMQTMAKELVAEAEYTVSAIIYPI